jgi:putative ABC transport system permease protein
VLRLSLRNIWSRKGRLVLTAIAVIAGAAFLNGVFVFTDTIKGSFNMMFATAYENTNAIVRSANVIEGQFGEEARDHIPASIVETVAAVEGVTEAKGDVTATAVATFEGTTLGQDGPPKFAGAWIESEGSPWSIAEGEFPDAPDEVVLDRASSRAAGVKVGDVVTVASRQQPRDFTVVGIATFAGSDTTGGASWTLFELSTAQEFLLGSTDLLDTVIVRSDGSVTDDELALQIDEALNDTEIETLTKDEIVDESQSAVAESLGFITIFLSIFALIAMFVGSFIIYNVFSISAAQRQRENALLRAIGASRAQVTRSMFVEALVVGVGGSAIGCVAGVGLAATILQVLSAVGFGPSDMSLMVNASGFVITLVIGSVVTVLCAVAPAIRSGRVPPLAALRDVSIDRADVSRARKVIGAVSVALAVAMVAWGLAGQTLALGGGVVFLFLSLIALGPFIATPVARAAGPVLGRLRGAAGTMAARNAARNPKRTALTAGALAVGLALLIGVAVLGASAKATTRSVIGDAFQSDYIVSPQQSNGGIGLPPTLAGELRTAGVGSVLGMGASAVLMEEKGEFTSKQVLVVDAADAAAVLQIEFVAGGFADLDGSGLLVSLDKSTRDGLAVGDVIETRLLDGGNRPLEVRGIFDSDVLGNLIVDRSLFDGSSTPLFDLGVFIKTDSGVTDENTAAITSVVDAYPSAKVQSREAYIDEQSKQIDGFLNFIYALLGMSIFIAVIGIVITLLLAVYERRRELGLLRAVGTTRRQVRSSVLWESLVTAVVGVIMGVFLGVSLGWIIVKALEDEGLSEFSLPGSTIVTAALMSLVFAAVASFVPARRAAKADILEAIATT